MNDKQGRFVRVTSKFESVVFPVKTTTACHHGFGFSADSQFLYTIVLGDLTLLTLARDCKRSFGSDSAIWQWKGFQRVYAIVAVIVLTMGKKGKGRKRRESNFRASHDVKEMAPPPITKDINAVPAKLRRIMQYRETGSLGSVSVNVGADIGCSRKQMKDSSESKQTKKENRNVNENKAEAPGMSAPNDGQIAENTSKPLPKRKRENEVLLQLAEKIKAHPVKTRINDRKRKFLEEKKKKRLSNAVVQALMNAPKKDHVAFGEVVQAPPQLTFPKKNKVRVKEAKPASIRLQVIEAYRQRKGTKTGLEKGFPVLVPTIDYTM